MTAKAKRGRPSRRDDKIKIFCAFVESRERMPGLSKAEFARALTPGIEADGHFAEWDDGLPRDTTKTRAETIARYITAGERLLKDDIASMEAEVVELRRTRFAVHLGLGGLSGLGAFVESLPRPGIGGLGGGWFGSAPLPSCSPVVDEFNNRSR